MNKDTSKPLDAYINSLIDGNPMKIKDIDFNQGYDLQELDFDEEIVLDFQSLPEDNTEGNEYRDNRLSELLHSDEWLEMTGEDLPLF